MSEQSKSIRLFLIFSILAALFVFSMFYRVSNAVIAPNLVKDLNLDAENLGLLGGAYFYAFALLQIPMGPMLDRIGPRTVMTAFPVIGALGAFLFAYAGSLTMALFGRILIGMGMACVLMGSLKVLTLRFPPERFASLTGIFVSVGTVGAILGSSPLAYLTSAIGWRTTFLIGGCITALLAFLVFWVLGERKGGGENFTPSSSLEPKIGVPQAIRSILGSLAFWQVGAVAFFRYGTLVTLQGLWLGPYLIGNKKLSPVQTGNLLLLLALGTVVGGPVAGWLSDRTFHSRKGLAIWGLSLYTLSFLPLMGVPKIDSPFWYGFTLFLMGFFNSFGMLIYSHAKELFPIAISGTVMTWVNFFTMAGGAVLMPTLGKVIQSFPRTGNVYPAEAYHLSFLVCFLGMAASLIFYAFSKKET